MLSALPNVMTRGPTGPTRSGFDWNVQQSTGQTANRWARRGASAWINALACQIVVGADTVLTTLSVSIYGTALATDSVTFVLQKNGVDTSLTVTLAAGAIAASASGSVAISKGDFLTLKANQSGTELQTNWWFYGFASD